MPTYATLAYTWSGMPRDILAECLTSLRDRDLAGVSMALADIRGIERSRVVNDLGQPFDIDRIARILGR
jgi:hypothetical protein